MHDFAKQHNLSDNAALNKLICEHQENQGQEIDILAKKVIDLLEGKYKNLFTRIRMASTMADRRTEVIVEILKFPCLSFRGRGFIQHRTHEIRYRGRFRKYRKAPGRTFKANKG